MAFSLRRLSVLAYASGFTLWHYKADADALPRATEAGFFDGAADMLAAGDMIMVSGPGGARMLAVAFAAFGRPVVTAPMC